MTSSLTLPRPPPSLPPERAVSPRLLLFRSKGYFQPGFLRRPRSPLCRRGSQAAAGLAHFQVHVQGFPSALQPWLSTERELGQDCDSSSRPRGLPSPRPSPAPPGGRLQCLQGSLSAWHRDVPAVLPSQIPSAAASGGCSPASHSPQGPISVQPHLSMMQVFRAGGASPGGNRGGVVGTLTPVPEHACTFVGLPERLAPLFPSSAAVPSLPPSTSPSYRPGISPKSCGFLTR